MATRATLLMSLVCLMPAVACGDELVSPILPAGFGVNIHFTDPKPGEMKMLAAAGFKFIRMDFDWARIEKEKGVYDFSAYERLLKELKPHDIRALFILDYANPLYDDNRSPDTDDGRAAFARWAAAGVKHFKGRGILWEMYNEPNIAPFWRPKPNVDDYVRLALEVGKAIREAAPDEFYIGPATSGVDLPFLEACFKAGLLESWDAVSVHPYRQQNPETVGEDYRQLRLLIAKYAPKGKTIPIVSGEWGYSSIWSGFDEDRQAKMLVRQWLVNLSQDVPLSIWYDWHDDGPDDKEPEHHFGTVRHEYRAPAPASAPSALPFAEEGRGEGSVYHPKPAYLAAKTLMDQLRGFKFNKRLAIVHDLETYVLLFESNSETKLVAWTTSPEPKSVAVPVGEGAFRLTSHLGQALGSRTSENNILRLDLTDAPIFVEPTKQSPTLVHLARWRRGPLEVYQRAAEAKSSWEKQPQINRATQRRWISYPWAPDGREPFFQRYLLIVTDPIIMTAQAPLGDVLPIRIENPSGEGFSGKLAVGEHRPRSEFKITLENKQTELLITIPLPHKGVQIGLLEDGRWGSRDMGAWQRLRFQPIDCSAASLSVRAEGDEKVPSKESFAIVDPPDGLPSPAGVAIRIDYRFDPGWKYICLSTKPDPSPIDGRPSHLGMWVKGDGSGNISRMRFVDSTGQTFQPDGPKLDFNDWRYVEFPLDGTRAGVWGGAKDGTVHYPIKLETIFLIDSAARQKTSGIVHICAPALVYRE